MIPPIASKAFEVLEHAEKENILVTGLLYIDTTRPDPGGWF